ARRALPRPRPPGACLRPDSSHPPKKERARWCAGPLSSGLCGVGGRTRRTLSDLDLHDGLDWHQSRLLGRPLLGCFLAATFLLATALLLAPALLAFLLAAFLLATAGLLSASGSFLLAAALLATTSLFLATYGLFLASHRLLLTTRTFLTGHSLAGF